MAQKTEHLNVAKIEYFDVAHISKTLEFSTLGASYRSTRLSYKLSKKLLWRLIFANKTTYSYHLIVCESSSRVITEFLKHWILIVDKEEPLMVAVLVYQLEDKAVHYFYKKPHFWCLAMSWIHFCSYALNVKRDLTNNKKDMTPNV